MLEINGAEGGGQLLRSALTLSLCTGTPFRMYGIRAGRSKPGLMRQHLTAVLAAAEIGGADVTGAALGAQDLVFVPGAVRGGDYRFSIGTAGSTTLVLQTLLPALCAAAEPSTLVLEGGTHNPMAPPADFLIQAYAPLLRQMGVDVGIELQRYGFYPAGGGRLSVAIRPAALQPLTLLARGACQSRNACALSSAVPSTVAERELAAVARRLGYADAELAHRALRPAAGPGNVLSVTLQFEHVTEVFVGFGERGIRAEAVAERVCEQVEAYVKSGAAVGPHLADQLLLPLALAGGGVFTTTTPTDHLTTNAALIEKFVAVDIQTEKVDSARNCWQVSVSR
jgi:RNA 3'-terminal phosphate cyclase (ATP)